MHTLNAGDVPKVRKLFGEMAVHKGYCTPKDIDHALNIQRQLAHAGQPPKLLGLILLEETIIDNAQFIDLLKDLDHAIHEERAANHGQAAHNPPAAAPRPAAHPHTAPNHPRRE